MVSMSDADVRAYEARQMVSKRSEAALGEPCEKESKLHAQIQSECDRRGWQAFHCSMHKKTTATRGMPDFIIQADGGRTIWIEAKAKDRKRTTDQIGVALWAAKLGHTVHVVRSFEEFLATVK